MTFFDENSSFASALKAYEPPKYYNGKVVCVKKSVHLTVGKVYEFIDGQFIDDMGLKRPRPINDPNVRVKSLYDAVVIGKFIPFVE